jgi:hypothetical protein
MMSDIDNMIFSAKAYMRYFSVIGQYPLLDRLLAKSPYCPFKVPNFADTASFCQQKLMERLESPDSKITSTDFLGRFLGAKAAYPNLIGDNEVISYLLLNVSS